LKFRDNEIEKVIADLTKWGYAITKNIISDETCIEMGNVLDEFEKQQLKIGNTHRVIKDGQLLIRNIQENFPELFLPILDLEDTWSILCSIFNDTPILDGLHASQSGLINGTVHIDSLLPITKFKDTTDIIVTVALDDFNAENGATWIWPFSHKSGRRIQELKSEDQPDIKKTGIPLIAPRGSVVYMLGQTWHQIRKNRNNQRRWGLIIHYKRWWIKPAQDFTKCGPEIYQMLSQRQKILYGFSTKPPRSVRKRLKTKMNPDMLPEDYYEALKL
jgi:ectoine hydroxylase-related dioxygenase (phytanoyl-CoA dioxygenase family)